MRFGRDAASEVEDKRATSWVVGNLGGTALMHVIHFTRHARTHTHTT